MSNTDGFIDEVNEEVRRDRLFALMKRYGWIAVLAVLLLVGGTAYREYAKAQQAAAAQAFGDGLLSALEAEDGPARQAALSAVDAPGPAGRALRDLLAAAEASAAGDDEAGAQLLQSIANDLEAPTIYRQIAQFKSLSTTAAGLSLQDRRAGLETLAVPGQPLALLAEEQLALLDIEEGAREAALSRLQGLIENPEATLGLQRRASQLIIALGGDAETIFEALGQGGQ